MAVDANVLIYERVREEMRAGKGLAGAVKEGYSKAYSAIIDANITTLHGHHPVQLRQRCHPRLRHDAHGRHLHVVVQRHRADASQVFYTRMENKKGMSFASKMTENWFTNTAVPFIARRRMAYIASALVIAGGVASLTTKGLNYGVEFTGGSTFDVTFEQPVDLQALRGALSTAFTEDGTAGNPIVQTKESDKKVRIMTNYMIDSEAENQDEQIQAALKGGLVAAGAADYTIDRYNKVDGTISDDFRRGATNATIFSHCRHLPLHLRALPEVAIRPRRLGRHDSRRADRALALQHLLGHPAVHHGDRPGVHRCHPDGHWLLHQRHGGRL